MQGLPLAVGLSLVGSLAGLLIAAALLLFPAETRGKLVPWLVSYAVGTLLGSSLLHLVPEALEQVPARQGVFAPRRSDFLRAREARHLAALPRGRRRVRHPFPGGIAGHHRGRLPHVHRRRDHRRGRADTSAPLGLSTAIAAATHEIPQELGDFGVLLHAGYSPRRALC